VAGRGRGFDATIAVPVTIRIPTSGSVTHVFTAVARNERACAGPRVTTTTGTTPKNALDRITNAAQDVLDRDRADRLARDPRSSSRTSC